MKVHQLNLQQKFYRLVWNFTWLFLFRPTPTFFYGWRNFLLRLFGAKIGRHVHIYPSVKIWAPWNFEIADSSCLAPGVNCYCVDKIIIGKNSTISQYGHLCTATHDYTDPCILETPYLPLLTAPIILKDFVWITADVFIGPGVTVDEGGVVLARSTVVKDIPSWTVCAGSPATVKKKRELRSVAN